MIRKDTIYRRIGNTIQRMGIPLSITGYVYLCDAVYLVVEDFSAIYSATKSVYPRIAKLNGVSSYSVQKCISNAVHIASRDPNPEMMETFGDYLEGGEGRPISPMEFIARITWKILLEIDEPN